MKQTKQKRIPVILFLLVAVVLVALLYLFNPATEGFFPQCPFHYFTGLDCPGCGTQRAFHSLLHLEIGQALSYNPLFVFSIPYLLVGFYFEYLGGKERFPRVRRLLFGRKAIILILGIILLYWVLRNMPYFF
ncbi:DUF2752 domain-containing protein [Dysgonomonas sp. 25]|uniref:DUF2752 domain-containing protein n=1 Tax=Dysgonomonas sp. 25 TaxID=2302933 RepID=UPI0013D28E73|nr:DUF2752 domain-containing protein [Dysgonomonas sp. 25]NDV68071.1 DUF2752 domain-containing protein [Dysgonomonas sp. 25]